MSIIDEDRLIDEAVRGTYLDAGIPWPRAEPGPVPLDRLIAAHSVFHEEVPGLNRAAAAALLGRWGVRWAEIPQEDPSLAGFIFANAAGGYIFVRRGDGLPRRRFTAAHELGHYRLHLRPELAGRDPADGEIVQTDETITESESGEDELTTMERQANRFAAELLMPESVCRALCASYSHKYGKVDRFLVYHLAGELLVSREAIARRLSRLGLIENPSWLAKERGIAAAGRKTAEAV